MTVGAGMYWGPASQLPLGIYQLMSTVTLNDSDNSIAAGFIIPKTGTITHIGFRCSNVTGNPPAFNAGLVTADASGNPTTTAYGGSANTTYDFTATGWVWIELATAATGATAGEFAFARLWPGATPPDASNRASISYDAQSAHVGEFLTLTYETSWSRYRAWSGALKYDDGTVVGQSLTTATTTAQIRTGSTPDEVGNLFQVPFETKCVGAVIWLYVGTTQDFTITLYDAANTVLASAAVDASQYLPASAFGLYEGLWASEVTLAADTDYRLVVTPTTNNGGLYVPIMPVNEAGSRAWFQEGARWQSTKRTDAGAWTDTPTQIVPCGLMVSDISGITV